jgi:shikimate kinase
LRIYLTGFMGAGKTTVGRALAENLRVPFIDLDAEVESRSGACVREIFDTLGEAHFRRLESESLRRTAALETCIVATGGGVPEEPENRAWMRLNGLVVWLDATLPVVEERLAQVTDRPLFGDSEEVARLFARRRQVYRDCDLEIEVAGKSVLEIAREIAGELGLANLR